MKDWKIYEQMIMVENTGVENMTEYPLMYEVR